MKKVYYFLALAASIMVLDSCRKEPVPEPVIPDDQKNVITFTASAETGAAALTKAGFSGGTEFDATYTHKTSIVARMTSVHNTNNSVRHTRTVLTATADNNAISGGLHNWNTYSEVTYNGTAYNRYWDDAWGRNAKLSVFAVAVPNYDHSITNPLTSGSTLETIVKQGTTSVGSGNTTWQNDTEGDLNKISWTVSTTQTDGYNGTIAKEDLCYSNNIQDTYSYPSGELNYGRGKDGVRRWNGTGYPEYSYSDSDSDHYPNLSDGPMQFKLDNDANPDGPGHFDKGHMIFHHALTRITVNLKKSTNDGFNTDGSDFVLTNDNVVFLNMPVTNILDIKTGQWASTGATTNEVKSARRSTNVASGADYTCFAQVIPGFVINGGSTENVFKFTVSENTYFVTHDQLFTSLNIGSNTTGKDSNGNNLVTVTDNKITLEQGKNYVFTITVKKTGVDVTASLVPWVNVTGEGEATNDYVKINIKDAETNTCSHFDLYRLNDDLDDIYVPETGPGTGEDWTQKYEWYGNYTQKAIKTRQGESTVWDTEWFWESNKTFYHFRTVNEGMVLYGNSGNDADATKDYFKIFGGPIQDYTESVSTVRTASDQAGTSVNDYHWGAPYKTGQSMKYDVQYGWSAADDNNGQIYPAIGSTKQTINMIEHHMMANIRIILKTKRDDAALYKLHVGGVHLKGSTIKLTRFYNEGTVEMGRGLVNVAGNIVSEIEITAPATGTSITDAAYYYDKNDHTVSKEYNFRVVPQALVRDSGANMSDYVGLTITTPDPEMNQYYVIKKLSEIKATSETAGNQTKNEYITRWYPGHDYTYTINISKTGIDAITCSVVEWNTVKGDDFDIDLED